MEIQNIREKKLNELKQKMLKEREQQERERDLERQLDFILRQALTQEAKTRLSNVGLVNRELYLMAAQHIIYLFQSGNIEGKLGEEEVKSLLEKLKSKKEIKIKRK